MLLSPKSKEIEKKLFNSQRNLQLNQNFQSKNVAVKQANSFLSKRLVDMEIQCQASPQYSIRECLEVVGVPDSVNKNELEDKVLTIPPKKNGCELSPRGIEACHQLRKKSDRVILIIHKGINNLTDSVRTMNKVTKLF